MPNAMVSHSGVYCPACSHFHDEAWSEDVRELEGHESGCTNDFTCERCGHEFEVAVFVSRTYEAHSRAASLSSTRGES